MQKSANELVDNDLEDDTEPEEELEGEVVYDDMENDYTVDLELVVFHIISLYLCVSPGDFVSV